jgi:hypothetical protein
MTKPLIVVAFVAAFAAGAASAQTQPQPPAPPPPPPMQAPIVTTPPWALPHNSLDYMLSRNWREQAVEELRERRRLEREILRTESPERVARAEQVASLLNQRRCADAYLVAANAGDAAMAGKVKVICRG